MNTHHFLCAYLIILYNESFVLNVDEIYRMCVSSEPERFSISEALVFIIFKIYLHLKRSMTVSIIFGLTNTFPNYKFCRTGYMNCNFPYSMCHNNEQNKK